MDIMNENKGNIMSMEMQSESINELAEALSKAQGEIEGASKDATNPFHKSKYADLHTVRESCREPLARNGLSVAQTTNVIDGQLCLVTTLLHKSGQWMRGRLPMMITNAKPQEYGTYITYFRRYGLSAMVGVTQYDDDGETSMERDKKEAKKAPETTTTEGKKNFTFDDLCNKMLSLRSFVPDVVKLKFFIDEKSKARGTDAQGVINSALSSELMFETFCKAFQVTCLEPSASPA